MRLTDCDNNLSVSPVFCFQNSLLRSHQKAKMLVLLAVVHIATAIMLFVSTIANVSPSPLFPHPRKDLRNSLVKG